MTDAVRLTPDDLVYWEDLTTKAYDHGLGASDWQEIACDLIAEVRASWAERDELVDALAEARDSIAAWGAYADDYFIEKWGLKRDLATADAVIRKYRK